ARGENAAKQQQQEQQRQQEQQQQWQRQFNLMQIQAAAAAGNFAALALQSTVLSGLYGNADASAFLGMQRPTSLSEEAGAGHSAHHQRVASTSTPVGGVLQQQLTVDKPSDVMRHGAYLANADCASDLSQISECIWARASDARERLDLMRGVQ